jgi:aspartate aminotransferase
MKAPLDRIDDLLDEHLRRVARRQTSIPTIAGRAKASQAEHPELVRADIGQIVGVDEALEVLYGPPVGLPAMRRQIAELYNLSFGIEPSLDEENVTICTGAAEALSLLFRCFGSGRRVGLPRGHWENYTNAVEVAGGTPVVVDFFDADGALDIDGLRRAIVDEPLSVLVANFPCNPTGAVLDAVETEALAQLVVDENIVLIADEVYARLRYDGVAAQSPLRHAPGHVVSIGSASKEYLLPGARVGYMVSARSDLTERVLRKLVRANTASPNVLGQQRLMELLAGDLDAMRRGERAPLVGRIRDAMQVRRDALIAVVERHGMALAGRPAHRPEGTIFLMAALPAWWEGDDVAFVEKALDEHRFSAIPGSAFGLPGSIRLSYGATRLEDIERLDGHLAAMR